MVTRIGPSVVRGVGPELGEVAATSTPLVSQGCHSKPARDLAQADGVPEGLAVRAHIELTIHPIKDTLGLGIELLALLAQILLLLPCGFQSDLLGSVVLNVV